MLRFRVTYHRVADLIADADQQIAKRGLFVRVAVDGVDRGTAVELEIVTPVGRAKVSANVLQPLGGAGLAVELDPAAVQPLIDKARRAPATASGGPPVHEQIEEIDGEDESPARPEPTMGQQQAQKIQQALHGDKNQRMAILRDQNRVLHPYVLRNPGLQLDELVFIARSATVSAELLTQIAARREWIERSEIAIALVRNPKTPVPIAIKALDHVGAGELRNLAKAQNVREAIVKAARKKVLG